MEIFTINKWLIIDVEFLDLIGVKGHLQTRTIQISEDAKRNIVEVIAEKVTYLSSKRAD